MRPLTTVCMAAVTCLLAGCNQPAVTLKQPAFQSSENTVRDWNDVADSIAARMAALGYLPGPGRPQAPDVMPPMPVFIRVQAPDSAFVRAVADKLTDDVLHAGGAIARTPAGATVVNLDVNFVRWGPRDTPPGLLGTAAAALAVPAIVAGDSTPMSTWTAADAGIFASVGVGALADLALAMTPTMNAEAIWQASIVTDDRVVMMMQEPVYIRAPDVPLYAKATSLTPMASWSSAAPLATRVIRFDP
jgi:hypothetical protein